MKIRASSMDRFLACPTSAQELEHPYNPDNPEAKLGTAKHAAIAEAIGGQDRVIEIAHEYGVDPDDVGMAVGAVKRLLKEIAGWMPGEVERLAEERLDGPAATGTADLVLVGGGSTPPSHIVIVDFKTGFSDDEHRYQLVSYADAARERWGMPTSGVITTVEGQLRHGERIVRNYSENDLAGFRLDVGRALASIGKKIVPGKHCGFCPRQLECPTRDSYINAATAALVELDQSRDYGISTVQLGAIYDRYKEVMRAADRYQKLVDAALEQGPIPLPGGRRLELHEVERTVVDVTALGVFDAMGWEYDDLREAVRISKSGLDRIVKSKVPTRGEAKILMRQLMTALGDGGALRTETRREKVVVDADAHTAVEPKGT